MKLFKLLTALVFLGLFANITLAQTVHQVAEGTDVLKPAIDAAVAGDIIELTTSGGQYLSADQISIDKDITIIAADGLDEKPVLKYIGTSTGAYMFKVVASPKLMFQGIEFDGDGVAQGGAALAKYALRLDNGDTLGTMEIRVLDCYLHDFNEKIIKPYANCGIDSLLVRNTTFENGAKEGVTLYSGSTSDPAVRLKFAGFENCTFKGFAREGIKADTNPNIVMRVNHCTFYDCGGTGKGMIYVDDLTDVVVKNSIFVNNGYGSYFARFESADNIFSNNLFYDVATHKIDKAAVTDTLFADPMFADATVGDFTLDAASPAIGYADDGLAVGDSRWDPNAALPQVHQVEAGTDGLKDAIAAAADGDIIELTSSGGIYLSTAQLIVDKSLIIMAREGLAEKPILKYIGTSTSAYLFKVKGSSKVLFEGLELDGDGVADGATDKAKYGMRFENSGLTDTMNVKINNCVFHDYKEAIIKPYKETGIDSLMISNSTFFNAGKEGILFYSGSSSDPAVELGYAEVMNCTFYNTKREAIKGDTNPDTKILVNQCTFYNIGGTDKPFIYVDDALDVQIKNSIFEKNLETGNHIRLENSSGNFVSNCVSWDVFDWEIDNATVTDTIHADPLFVDAANADFTLGALSPARTQGAGGTPAGDLRWAIDPNSKIVSVTTVGSGIVTLDPSGGVYAPGTSVTLTALPDAGWEFEGWSGISVFPPDQNPTTITVNDNVTATATFKNLTPQVTLVVDSIGLGSVLAVPEVGDDGTYDLGATVVLTAVPATDWEFVEWLGDITSTDNPVSFAVDSNMTVTASYKSTFTQFALNMNLVGKGNVSINPMPVINTYDTNTVVHLTAIPANGWTFEGWTVDLTSTSLLDSVTMNSDKNITATFLENQIAGGVLEIDSTWDLYDAVDYANNNSTVHTLLLTTAGVYTSHSTSTVRVKFPLSIIAADGLDSKPILTNSDPDGTTGEIDILRISDDITLKGVIIDGSTTYSAGMKYGVRYANSTAPDTVKWGSNATFIDVEFRHLYDDGKPSGDGHAFKVDKELVLGVVKFDGCKFNDIGYEAIRISENEKWLTDRAFDSLIVRNCTFTNIDAEGIRYYSDLDPLTPDAPVIIEHVTFDNSATRTMYLKNSGGAVVRDIIISNSRQSGHGRDADLMDVQGNTADVLSYVSHIDTFNVPDVPIKTIDNVVDTMTVYGINPMYEDAASMNWTLLANSHLYGLGHDGKAIGDLNWATNTPTSVSLEIVAENGMVEVNPMPIGKTYDPGTVVTVTAIPDSGYMLVNWSGDLSGTDNPTTITMDANKSISAIFDVDTGVNGVEIPKEFGLAQNYPNPFNPSTTINFALPTQAVVTLRVYDILGQVVTTLFNNEVIEAGYQKINWNGINLASGLYIYRLNAKGIDGKEFTKSMKMMFLK